jgi:benzil reductase ((S)-benzoin forming)
MDVLQDKIAYVTGSSKGIGKALAELLLNKGFKVIGYSRTNSIEHPNFTYQKVDLSNLDEVKNIRFSDSAKQVLLINNAGLIGKIGPVGTVDSDSVTQVINVNTIAPQILCNEFVKTFGEDEGDFHIINISSGAAQKPIDAWATYCSSKAAIDLFSETLAEELDWRNHEKWRVHSCAPGVVDTAMQSQIRSASEEDFKHVQNFKDLKENDELFSSDYVAEKLCELIENPSKFPETVISVRNF